MSNDWAYRSLAGAAGDALTGGIPTLLDTCATGPGLAAAALTTALNARSSLFDTYATTGPGFAAAALNAYTASGASTALNTGLDARPSLLDTYATGSLTAGLFHHPSPSGELNLPSSTVSILCGKCRQPMTLQSEQASVRDGVLLAYPNCDCVTADLLGSILSDATARHERRHERGTPSVSSLTVIDGGGHGNGQPIGILSIVPRRR